MDPARKQDLDSFVAELMTQRDKLAEELPEIDPEDLFCILHSLMRPIGTGRRFFLRRQEDGSYVI